MEFWELIAEARAEAAHTSEWPSGMQIGSALARRLPGLKPVQILEFDLWLRGQAAMADRWELGAACYLFCGYVSDDGFAEFRFGLVGLGHDDFHAVLKEPDEGLAALPTVQAMAAGHASPFTIHGEQIQSAPAESYGDHYWQDRADFTDPRTTPHFTPSDAPLIPTRLPALHTLFPNRPTFVGVPRWDQP